MLSTDMKRLFIGKNYGKVLKDLNDLSKSKFKDRYCNILFPSYIFAPHRRCSYKELCLTVIYLLRLNMTAKELSIELNISEDRIYRLLRGDANVSMDETLVIVNKLGKNISPNFNSNAIDIKVTTIKVGGIIELENDSKDIVLDSIINADKNNFPVIANINDVHIVLVKSRDIKSRIEKACIINLEPEKTLFEQSKDKVEYIGFDCIRVEIEE